MGVKSVKKFTVFIYLCLGLIFTRPYELIRLRSFKVYKANSDQNSVVVNTLIYPIEARFVRLDIEAWYGHISMRFELYGCHVLVGEKC